MPGTRPRRDSFTRLMSSSTRRAPVPSGGVGINRVPRSADRSSGSNTLGVFGELHYVDAWEVADDSDDTFRTTFRPLNMSWNLMLNGLRVHRDEWSIDGRVITITNPTELFLGADTQGTPWNLEIQYDYRIGATPAPALIAAGGAGSLTNALPVPLSGLLIADGDMLVLAVGYGFSLSGTPAGWTLVDSQAFTAGGFGKSLSLLVRDALASDTSVTLNFTGTDHQNARVVNLRNASVGATLTQAGASSTTFTTDAVPVSASGWGLHAVVHGYYNFTFDALSMDSYGLGTQLAVGIAHAAGDGSAQGCTSATAEGWASISLPVSGL